MDIIDLYDKYVPVIDIAKSKGVSRQWIYKVLNKHGVDTRKRKVEAECANCGKKIMAHKGRIRKFRNLYCDRKCFVDMKKDKKGG